MTDYLYPNAVVYLIIVAYEIYVGSTIDMINRLKVHKYDLKNDDPMKLYIRMRELDLDFNNDDVEIIILEKYPCDDKKKLRRREGVYQQELEATLNDRIAGRTRQDWIEENPEYMKEYRENNKEHIQDYMKKYRENNKEHIQDYMKKYMEEYREKNKEKIKTKKSEKTECQYCKKQRCKRTMKQHHKVCPDKPSGST